MSSWAKEQNERHNIAKEIINPHFRRAIFPNAFGLHILLISPQKSKILPH